VTVEESIRVAVAAEMAPLRTEISRLSAQVEAMRRAIPPALVPVREAAQALGVSEATVRRRIRDGDMPTVRVGRSVRVDLGALRSAGAGEVTRLVTAIRFG
jgi:excisionase family DNA binding protein